MSVEVRQGLQAFYVYSHAVMKCGERWLAYSTTAATVVSVIRINGHGDSNIYFVAKDTIKFNAINCDMHLYTKPDCIAREYLNNLISSYIVRIRGAGAHGMSPPRINYFYPFVDNFLNTRNFSVGGGGGGGELQSTGGKCKMFRRGR